ncbi:MAG: hypothetical protein AAFX78_03525 [Cyanobacteria bacterium J06638_20]
MASPFQSLANLTMVFNVPSSDLVVDQVGSPASVTTEFIAIAYAVQQNRSDRDRHEYEAGSLAQIRYGGYWVNPLRPSPALVTEQQGDAVVWRPSAGFALPVTGFADLLTYEAFKAANSAHIAAEGKLVLELVPPGPYGVEAQTGDVFAGVLITKTQWGNAL